MRLPSFIIGSRIRDAIDRFPTLRVPFDLVSTVLRHFWIRVAIDGFRTSFLPRFVSVVIIRTASDVFTADCKSLVIRGISRRIEKFSAC